MNEIIINGMIDIRFLCSSEAFTAKYVAILALLAFLSILPAVYHNRAAIKSNIRKFGSCTKNCCGKNRNEIPYSDVSVDNSTCYGEEVASEEDQQSYPVEN